MLKTAQILAYIVFLVFAFFLSVPIALLRKLCKIVVWFFDMIAELCEAWLDLFAMQFPFSII